MGYFDFLIDLNTANPKVDMEYIYMMDEAWKPGELGSYPFSHGSVVIDVKKLPCGSFEFRCKESGEIYRTNYAWALAENTPANLKRIDEYIREREKLEIHKKIVDKLSKSIKTLKNE